MTQRAGSARRRRIAVIPARGGSKRVPRKNVVDFLGRPLMLHVLEAARASALFDEIHVSTEDDEIAGVAERAGFGVAFRRAAELADDVTGIADVVKWVLGAYERRGETFDDVCLLYATAVLLEAADITAALTLFEARGRMAPVLAVAKFPCPAEWAMHLADGDRLIAREPGMVNVRSQDLAVSYYDAGSLMWTSRDLLKQPSAAPTQFIGYELAQWKAVDIDDRSDLELAEILYRGKHIGPH